MIICVEKATGKVLEMQSNATPEILIQNAISAGYSENDIQIKTVTEEEWQAILDAQSVPIKEPTLEEKNRADIDYLAIMMGVDLSV